MGFLRIIQDYNETVFRNHTRVDKCCKNLICPHFHVSSTNDSLTSINLSFCWTRGICEEPVDLQKRREITQPLIK